MKKSDKIALTIAFIPTSLVMKQWTRVINQYI